MGRVERVGRAGGASGASGASGGKWASGASGTGRVNFPPPAVAMNSLNLEKTPCKLKLATLKLASGK